jgi:hypothetical protein
MAFEWRKVSLIRDTETRSDAPSQSQLLCLDEGREASPGTFA